MFRWFAALYFVIIGASACESRQESTSQQKKRWHNEEYVLQVNRGEIADEYEGSVYRINSASSDSLKITITYGSPGVRKRVIWGKLVPFDSVWVSGAIVATAIEFSKDVTVAGHKLKSGKYAFFTIPGRKSWKIIFNKDYNQHNTSNYDSSKDLFRVDVVPDTLLRPTERLTYDLVKGDSNDVKITLAWEKLSISFLVNSSK